MASLPNQPPAAHPAGLLLLTGGQGRRFGGPKHSQPHPAGGTWGSHLVDVFLEVFPGGPVQLLGEPLPDRPGLTLVRDPGQGPAAALVHWASLSRDAPLDPALRWWIVACDQVRWTAQDLGAWHAQVLGADPEGVRWVMARMEGHTQYLGGFMPDSLIGRLQGTGARSMRGLAEALPGDVLEWPNACWLDVDSSEDLGIWREDWGHDPGR